MSNRRIPNTPDGPVPDGNATVVRKTPFNPDAECSAIGAAMISQSAFEVLHGLVTVDDFYMPAAAATWAALDELWRAGEPIDIVTVQEKLKAAGKLETLGGWEGWEGPSFLLHCQTRVPATSNAGAYGRIIMDLSVLRRLIKYGFDIVDDAYSLKMPGAELAEAARERLDAVEVQSTSLLPAGLSTLGEFLDRPEEEYAPWAVPGLVRQNWRVMLVAGEGAGKSVLLRQIAISAAAGLHPLTHRPIRAIRTLVIDAENTDEGIDEVCSPMYAVARELDDWDEDRCWLWRQPAGIDLRRRPDRIELESIIRACQPDLVCLGPVYKTYRSRGGDDKDEGAVAEVQAVLDDLRTRHSFGLLLEHHAPHGENERKRAIRPHGSVLWQRWPELGIALLPVKDRDGSLELGRFRGDRLKNQWPEKIHRSGNAWPWDGSWVAGAFDADHPEDPEPEF